MAVTPGRATINGAAAGHCLAAEFAGVQGPLSMCRRVAVKMLLSSQCVVQIDRAHLPTQGRWPYQPLNLPAPEFTGPRIYRSPATADSAFVSVDMRYHGGAGVNRRLSCHIPYLISPEKRP